MKKTSITKKKANEMISAVIKQLEHSPSNLGGPCLTFRENLKTSCGPECPLHGSSRLDKNAWPGVYCILSRRESIDPEFLEKIRKFLCEWRGRELPAETMQLSLFPIPE